VFSTRHKTISLATDAIIHTAGRLHAAPNACTHTLLTSSHTACRAVSLQATRTGANKSATASQRLF